MYTLTFVLLFLFIIHHSQIYAIQLLNRFLSKYCIFNIPDQSTLSMKQARLARNLLVAPLYREL